MTLIGFSLGARVVFEALNALSQDDANRAIDTVMLLGGAIDSDAPGWKQLQRRCGGPVVNAFSTNDDVLGMVYPFSEGSCAAGSGPIRQPGILDVDVTDIVGGHEDYERKMPAVLDRIDSKLAGE